MLGVPTPTCKQTFSRCRMARGNSSCMWQVFDPPTQDIPRTALRRVEIQKDLAPGSIRTRLEAVIEAERRNLARAESVAGCLAIALHEHPQQDESTPPPLCGSRRGRARPSQRVTGTSGLRKPRPSHGRVGELQRPSQRRGAAIHPE